MGVDRRAVAQLPLPPAAPPTRGETTALVLAGLRTPSCARLVVHRGSRCYSDHRSPQITQQQKATIATSMITHHAWL